MKKNMRALVFVTAVLAFSMAGCGKNQAGSDDNGTNLGNTEDNAAVDPTGAGNMADAEGSSQLQLGSAVEISAGFQGELAETSAHAQLEKAITEYCGIAESDYVNVRYYYNYVDLNGDGTNEILALALGQKVSGINGNVLLWMDETDDNIGAGAVRQAFWQVGVPVYISNHMTEGYRDLILDDNRDALGDGGGRQAEDIDVSNAGRTADGRRTSLQRTAGLDETTGENGAALIALDPSYMLLTWEGGKYQDFENGTALSSLEGYEGTAILTNNIESDFINDNYHVLGEAMR